MARATSVAALLVVTVAITPTFAGELDELKGELAKMRQQMQTMQNVYQKQVDALQQRIEVMERQPAPPAAAVPSRPGSVGSVGGVDLSVGLSIDTAAGGSSVNNDILGNLQAGDHDPNKNGFRAKSVELFLGGTVDPYFDAQSTVAFQIDDEGETKIELEEAFFTTRSLPGGLQIKGGMYFTEFGRLNTMHSHDWAFVDQPFALSRILGPDGLRSPGARVSWLTPLPFYSGIIYFTKDR